MKLILVMVTLVSCSLHACLSSYTHLSSVESEVILCNCHQCKLLCCSVEVRQILGYTPPLYYLFNSLMVLLVVLHVYWFVIICKIALDKVLEGKDVEDTREE